MPIKPRLRSAIVLVAAFSVYILAVGATAYVDAAAYIATPDYASFLHFAEPDSGRHVDKATYLLGPLFFQLIGFVGLVSVARSMRSSRSSEILFIVMIGILGLAMSAVTARRAIDAAIRMDYQYAPSGIVCLPHWGVPCSRS